MPAVVDKGEGKGALVYFEKELRGGGLAASLLCTVSSTLFLRADGGCGSFGTPPDALAGVGLRPARVQDEITTPSNSAFSIGSTAI